MYNIINPTPVTTSTFAAIWINYARLEFGPSPVPCLFASFLPYDGSAHLLANGGKIINIAASANAAIAPLLAALQAEVTRQSGNNAALQRCIIAASDPGQACPNTGYLSHSGWRQGARSLYNPRRYRQGRRRRDLCRRIPKLSCHARSSGRPQP